jgi:lysozyme family protein
MKYNQKMLEKLAKELVELWSECKIRSERIEDLAKQLDSQMEGK